MTNKITKVYKNWVAYDIYASGWAAGTGDVTWPSSSTDADIALFNWATGKIIKDSWKKLSDYQTALSTQTAYSAKWTTTKVPQITTNTLWQVTTITEKSIAFPVTSVNGSTWAVTWLQTTGNLKTSLTDNSDSYYPSQKAVKTAVDGKQATLVSWTNIKTVNSTSLLGSGDVSINAVPSWWSTGNVLTKTSNGYWWAAPSGWISNDTTGTTSTVTGIWAWSEAEYTSLSTKSWTVLYFTF